MRFCPCGSREGLRALGWWALCGWGEDFGGYGVGERTGFWMEACGLVVGCGNWELGVGSWKLGGGDLKMKIHREVVCWGLGKKKGLNGARSKFVTLNSAYLTSRTSSSSHSHTSKLVSEDSEN